MMVRFHTLEWFTENAYEDETGDYWPSEEAFNIWNAPGVDCAQMKITNGCFMET